MNAYDHARWIIERNRQTVEMMAQALLEVESLEADEIKVILEKSGARLH